MRLIDADKLIEFIDPGHLRPPTEVCFSEYDVCRMIEQAPTIDAWTKAEHNADAFHAYVEGKKSARRHGEWLEKEVFSQTILHGEMQSARCSCCGLHHTTPYMYYFKGYEYCPNCGAKMDGGDD